MIKTAEDYYENLEKVRLLIIESEELLMACLRCSDMDRQNMFVTKVLGAVFCSGEVLTRVVMATKWL